ncbi:MAG: riboflavin synthase [Candidatus Peribacteraceae bacterium]|nr:riboflavin synthase [Candidatus Peribacteraceae bacterium]
MFTGIVEVMAPVLSHSAHVLAISRPKAFEDTCLGSSICVSGVCLTVKAGDAQSLTFDTVPETLTKTTLGALNPGDKVNLERALSASGRFEGHIVQGHGEGVGEVTEVRLCEDESRELVIRLPQNLARCVVSKGSIAVDGVSLTVADIKDCDVRIALIPYTLSSTTLGLLSVGGCVNIETDVLGRYVGKLLTTQPSS